MIQPIINNTQFIIEFQTHRNADDEFDIYAYFEATHITLNTEYVFSNTDISKYKRQFITYIYDNSNHIIESIINDEATKSLTIPKED